MYLQCLKAVQLSQFAFKKHSHVMNCFLSADWLCWTAFKHCKYISTPHTTIMHSHRCRGFSPLCLYVMIGGTDEGSRSFTQMQRADSRLPSLQVANCSAVRCRKKIKGDNALVHLGPGCCAQLNLTLALPNLAYNISCSVCEACMGSPWPATQHVD